MARGVDAALGELEGDIVDVAGLGSVELLGAPLVLLGLVDAPFGAATPLDVSFEAPLGVMLLGALLLGALLLGAKLGEMLLEESAAGVDVVLDAGRLRLTSPLDVPVTVLLGDALVTGTQSVLLVAELAAPAVIDGVPAPLAPFVAFGPVRRCSGFVAVLRAESEVAPVTPATEPVAEAEPGLIVVDVE